MDFWTILIIFLTSQNTKKNFKFMEVIVMIDGFIFPYFYNLPLRIRVDLFNNFAPVIIEERSVEKFAKAHFFFEVTITRKLYC